MNLSNNILPIPCAHPRNVNDLPSGSLLSGLSEEDMRDVAIMKEPTPDLSRANIFDIGSYEDGQKASNRRNQAQGRIEQKLIQKGRCMNLNPDLKSSLNLRLFQYNEQKVINQLTNSPQNGNFHDNLSCMVDAIIYPTPDEGIVSRTSAFIDKLKLILMEDAGRSVMFAHINSNLNINNSDSIFVLKSSYKPKSELNDIVHEVLIGFYVTNRLRQYVPNFMYVYGFFNCASPLSDESSGKVGREGGENIITWCQSQDNQGGTYIVVENIRNATTIIEYIKLCDYVDFIKVFYQIVNALVLAYKLYGYLHLDFHGDNILVRTFSQSMAVPFYDNNNQIIGYITGRDVPFIIDYGTNRAVIDDLIFANTSFNPGVDEINPLTDIEALIYLLAIDLYRLGLQDANHRNIFNALTLMYKFFSDVPLIDIFASNLGPPTEYENKGRPLAAFLVYISNMIPIPLETNISSDIYVIANNANLDFCEFIANISSGNFPISLTEYNITMEQVPNIPDQTQQVEVRRWLRSFDVVATVNREILILNEINLKFNNRIQIGDPITHIPTNFDEYMIETAPYNHELIELGYIKDSVSKYIISTNQIHLAYRNSGKIRTSESARKQVEAIREEAQRMRNYYDNQLSIVKHNVEILKEITEKNEYGKYSEFGEYAKQYEDIYLSSLI